MFNLGFADPVFEIYVTGDQVSNGTVNWVFTMVGYTGVTMDFPNM
jgi:hypothetical protein